VEYVEPLSARDGEERWLVRLADGSSRVVWVVHDVDDDWLEAILRDTRRWVGFQHGRVVALDSIVRVGRMTLAVVGDDRGPTFVDAAQQLAGEERERWVIAQIIALSDALAEMTKHVPKSTYGRLEPEHLVVDPTGRVRLRTPMWPQQAPERRPMVIGQARMHGTPAWLSPEQVRGTSPGPTSDVFSLATLAHAALTGTNPFAHESMMDTLMAIMEARRAPLALATPGLDAVLARAFAAFPSRRFPDPAAFGMALYECVPDAGDYDLVVSDRVAAWWPTAPMTWSSDNPIVHRPCDMTWEALAVRHGELDIRDCARCQQPVVRVRSAAAVLPLIGRACVAYQR